MSCPKCGSEKLRHVRIHGGQSLRQDCGKCGHFLDFVCWHGKFNSVGKERPLVTHFQSTKRTASEQSFIDKATKLFDCKTYDK